MQSYLEILAFALLAAASPTTLLAALVVLGTDRGRLNGLLFGAAFVLGQAIGIGIPLLVGVAVTESSNRYGTVTASLELALGVLMVLGAFRLRGPKRNEPTRGESRAEAAIARLEHVDPKAAFTLGIPLGIGVKRLVLAILAASTIALSASSRVVELQQSSVYVVIASLPVWLPVAVYFIVGPRADELVHTSRTWLVAHQRDVTFYLALGFGLLFVVGGVVGLAS